MIVVDASAVVEVLLKTSAADAIASRVFRRENSLHAPHLIDVEVAQVLRRYVRNGDVSATDGQMLLQLFAAFPVRRHSHHPLLARMWALRQNLTAYDAAYVALAEGLNAVLVTRDARLASAPGIGATVEVI